MHIEFFLETEQSSEFCFCMLTNTTHNKAQQLYMDCNVRSMRWNIQNVLQTARKK